MAGYIDPFADRGPPTDEDATDHLDVDLLDSDEPRETDDT